MHHGRKTTEKTLLICDLPPKKIMETYSLSNAVVQNLKDEFPQDSP